MERTQILTKVIFSIALAYFATSIIFLTFEMREIRESIPVILDKTSQLGKDSNIPIILQTIKEVTLEIKEVREEIPLVLKEIEEVRKLTPLVLEQIDNTNKNIPNILQEVKLTRESVPSILNESEQIRKSIPPILDEVKAVRLDIPDHLARTEKITDNIAKLSNQAASGAVKGTVKGVLSLPYELLKTTTEKVTPDKNNSNSN